MDNWKFLCDTICTTHKDPEEHLAMILVALSYVMDEKGDPMPEGRLLKMAQDIREKP